MCLSELKTQKTLKKQKFCDLWKIKTLLLFFPFKQAMSKNKAK